MTEKEFEEVGAKQRRQDKAIVVGLAVFVALVLGFVIERGCQQSANQTQVDAAYWAGRHHAR